jgi:hypothetical protein
MSYSSAAIADIQPGASHVASRSAAQVHDLLKEEEAIVKLFVLKELVYVMSSTSRTLLYWH